MTNKKIEELLLSKPMDALLYQKELLDIQRALQTQIKKIICGLVGDINY